MLSKTNYTDTMSQANQRYGGDYIGTQYNSLNYG